MTFFYLNECFKRLFESYAHESAQHKRCVDLQASNFRQEMKWDSGREKEMRGINPRILRSIGEGFQ